MAADASVKNVDQLRQFGSNLRVAGDNLTTLFQRLNMQMHQVCEGWNDSKNQAFMADFEEKCRTITQLSEEMQQYSQYIARTCDILDQYRTAL